MHWQYAASLIALWRSIRQEVTLVLPEELVSVTFLQNQEPLEKSPEILTLGELPEKEALALIERLVVSDRHILIAFCESLLVSFSHSASACFIRL